MTEDEAKELYAHFGLAAYRAQCVEMEAGTLLFAFIKIGNRISQEEVAKAIDASIERETFGRLLKVIKEVVDFEDSGLKAVDDALKNRNYLAHHFFRVHAFDMLSAEGREKMIEELEVICGSFDVADALLHVVTLAILKSTGISEEELQALIQKEMKTTELNK